MLDDLCPRTIVDVGIYEGVCAAFLAAYARPDRLAAIDIDLEFPALEGFADAAGLGDVLSVHGGIDQRDRSSLLAAVDRGVGSDPIDLIIDDASHRYFETVCSFEALSPRLRVGGGSSSRTGRPDCSPLTR
ncbi:MAG: class I SAM-dependent methyltransferase [Acidimicrobiales bacterium]